MIKGDVDRKRGKNREISYKLNRGVLEFINTGRKIVKQTIK